MTENPSGSQRRYIANKYEFIYAAVEKQVTAFIDGAKTPADETYRELKAIVDGVWATSAWAIGATTWPSPQEQLDYFHTYLSQRERWTIGAATTEGDQNELRRARDALYTAIIKAHAKNADLVMDLGCGWGHRMVDLHLAGLAAPFFGGDLSEHSRATANAVTSLFPEMKANWFHFDFLSPDFSPIPAAHRRAAVFTCYAIEQVEKLGTALFDKLTDRFDHVTGIHLEPIAPQFGGEWERMRATLAKRGYNVDLLEVVRSHPRLEVIDQKELVFTTTAGIPTSLVVWRKVR